MGFIDRLKALVPSFTSRNVLEDQQQLTNDDPDLMPDSSTQTPERWNTNSAITTLDSQHLPSRPPTRGKMAAEMDPREHAECWAIINKWAQYKDEEEEEKDRIENEKGMRLIGDGADVDEAMMDDICPTPGSGRGTSYDVSPLYLNNSARDVVMQDSGDQELDAFTGEVPVPPTPSFGPVEDNYSIHEALENVPGAAPVQDDTFELDDFPMMPEHSPNMASAGVEGEAAMLSTVDDPTVARLASDKHTLMTSEDEDVAKAEAQLQSDAMQFVQRSSEGDPTLPQMPKEADLLIESLALGLIDRANMPKDIDASPPEFEPPSPFHQRAVPSFPYDIQAAAQLDIAQEVSVNDKTSDLAGPQSVHDQASDLASHNPDPETLPEAPTEVQVVAHEEQLAISTQGAASTILPSDASIYLAQPHATDIERFDHIIIEKRAPTQALVTADSQHASPYVAVSPPKMPVKLPDSFHQAVLDEAVAANASPEEQRVIMQSLRRIELEATMEDVKEVEGAMEVDETALASRTIIGPVAPSRSPSPAPAKKGRKRKSDGQAAGDNAKKTKQSQVQALTNEEHFANGWTYLPKEHFASWKAPALKDYLRTIASERRWWNGLNKDQTLKKIVEWHNTMKAEYEARLEREDANDSGATQPAQVEEEKSSASSRTGSNVPSTKQANSHASTIASRKSKSKTPAIPHTPADQVGLKATRNLSGASSVEKSVFYDPDAEQRSSPFVESLKAVKTEEDVGEDEAQAMPNHAPILRRSRSKTADSAKSGMKGTKRASEGSTEGDNATKKAGRGRKSMEPGEAVGERVRSLRSRTASIAPEQFDA